MDGRNPNCDSTICGERFDNLKNSNEKLELRVAELEKKTDRIDNNFVKLETKFDIYTVTTSEKFDNLAKESREGNRKLEDKIDEFIRIMENKIQAQGKSANEFGEWLKKLGLKILEYGILVALILGVLHNIDLI